MKHPLFVSRVLIFGILTLSRSALAAEGTIFTPGQIVISYGNTAVVKVSNHTSSPLVNVVVLAVGGKDVIEFQQTLHAIKPRQTVDVIYPSPRDPLNWQPIVFVPSSAGDEGVYLDVFIQQGDFKQAIFSDTPTTQYPNKLWYSIPKSGFTEPDVLTYGEMPQVSSRSFGPIQGGLPQSGDVVLVKNLGTSTINAFLYCLDRNGQKVQACGGPTVIQAHDYSAAYAVQFSKPVFLVLCAQGGVSELSANVLLGSVNYPNELWDVHHRDDLCAGEIPSKYDQN
jgi:hypothetical protein